MLRTAPLLAWLTIITICFSAIAVGQSQDHSAVPTAAGGAASGAPGLFELAQNRPTNLVDRLKAIRNGTTSSAPADTAETSSRRSSRRAAAAPATPAAPVTPAPITPAPENEMNTLEPRQPAPDLPSVLVRRGASPEPAAPITDVSELTTTGDPEPETVWETADARGESSRRTARRWQSPETPARQAPAAQLPATTFHSAPGGGSGTLTLSEQGPTLRVEALGPKTISVGKSATYRIRLLNQGREIARGVVVTATVPPSAQVVSATSPMGSVREATDAAGSHRVTWSLDQVSGSSQQELAIDLKATVNQPIDLQVDWMYRPEPLSARIEVQQPQLAVNVDGPVEMRYGETKVFRVRLSNPGNGPAERVAVNISATGANAEPRQIGTLSAGESRTLEMELTANQAGSMKIRTVATGDANLQAEAEHIVRVRRPVLAVQVSAPGMIYAGTTAMYKIRVANRGDAVAEGVIMQVELPAGAKNGIGVDKKPITLEQPRWRVGDLTPGAERTYSMQCDLTADGQNQLVARIQSEDDSVASDSAITVVEAIADLKLIVNDPKGPIPVGQDAVYEIQVVNRGSKEARDVKLVAQFSEGIEPSAASGQRAEIVPGQVIFEPITSVPAGAQVSVKITARAAQNGNLRFRAELNCRSPETKLVAEESTRFYGAPAGAASAQTATRSANEPTPARR